MAGQTAKEGGFKISLSFGRSDNSTHTHSQNPSINSPTWQNGKQL